MIKRALYLAAILAIAACGDDQPPPAQARDQPAVERQVSWEREMSGEWVVHYEDAAFGVVTGHATLFPGAGQLLLTLRRPGDDAGQMLEVAEFDIRGDELTFSLPDPALTGAVEFRGIGDRLEPASRQLRLSFGGSEVQLPINTAPPSPRTVSVSLRYDPDSDTLSGSWEQPVNAATGQPDSQASRQGRFSFGSYADGSASVMGFEHWRRPQLVIKSAFAINRQFSAGLTRPYYPYQPEGEPTERMIMVLGQQLPRARLADIDIDSTDSGISYQVYKVHQDYLEDPQDSYWRDLARQRMREAERHDNAVASADPDDGFIIVRARIEPGTAPGLKTFVLNGVEGQWRLGYGDLRGSLAIARDLTLDLRPATPQSDVPIDTLATPLVYRPEPIYFELHASSDIPFESIPLNVAVNGELRLFDGRRDIVASRSANPNEAGVYRTQAVWLRDGRHRDGLPDQTMAMDVNPDDLVQLSVAPTGPFLFLDAPFAQARVVETPQAAGQALGATPEHPMSWREAVYAAARCAGIDEAMQTPASALARQDDTTFTTWLPFQILKEGSPVIRETPLKVGEHAAMMLMRQVLISVLSRKISDYATPQDDLAMLGLHRQLEAPVRAGESIFARLEVDDPGLAGPTAFEWSFYPTILEDDWGLTGEAAERYRIAAMRGALAQLVRAMTFARDRLSAVDACDAYELIQLVGRHMERVESLSQPLLVKLADRSQPRPHMAWVADRQAMAQFQNVSRTAANLAEQEDTATEDWQNYQLAVGLLTLPLSLFESGVVAAAVMLIDITDLGVTVVRDETLDAANSTEIEFAKGVGVINGTHRYDEASASETDDLVRRATALVSLLGLPISQSQLRDLQTLVRKRDAGVVRAVQDASVDGLNAVRGLSRQQKLSALREFHFAERKAQRLGEDLLDDDERLARALGDLLDAEPDLVRPPWAARLSQQAYEGLDDMARRTEIQELVARHGDDMERHLKDPVALKLLRLPQDGIDKLNAAVAKAGRKSQSKGGDFYEEFAEEIAGRFQNPRGFEFTPIKITDFDSADGPGQTAVMDVLLDLGPNGKLTTAKFTRSRLPYPEDPNRTMLEFEVAQTFKTNLPGDVDGAERVFPAPRWIMDPSAPQLRSGRPGVPLVMYSTLRMANKLGIRYGDPSLAAIKLSTVFSANTCAQLNWLRHTYPTKSVDELFEYTHSYQYLESTATQLGFRIKPGGIKVVLRPSHKFGYDELFRSAWFDPSLPVEDALLILEEADPVARQALRAAYRDQLEAAEEAFKARYRVPGTEVEYFFDVYAELEPIASGLDALPSLSNVVPLPSKRRFTAGGWRLAA